MVEPEPALAKKYQLRNTDRHGGQIVTTFWLRVQRVTSVKVASILIYFMLNSWRIFCKTYSRITIQITHGLNDIGTG